MPTSRSISASGLAEIGTDNNSNGAALPTDGITWKVRKSGVKSEVVGTGSKSGMTRSVSQPTLAADNGLSMLSPYVKHAVSLHQGRYKTKAKRKKIAVTANLAGTKYSIVKRVCIEAGMIVTEDEAADDCLLIWNDCAVPVDFISELRSYQKINHFPAMGEICRKDSLARNLMKMARANPEEYKFFPRTWICPGEYSAFSNFVKEVRKRKKHRTYIVKPATGAMGQGIWLTRNCDRLHSYDNHIIQEYIDKPLLMDGFKFDLRLYVLVTSCDPLRVFLYNDGMVRMSTEKYQAPSDANLDCQFMHLTNYSINKHSEAFINTTDEDLGTKRTLKHFMEWVRDQDEDFDELWSKISDVIVKTLIVAEPHVFHAYHMCRPSDPPSCNSVCFEILGFDILVDKKFRPWVIEVNRAPSFGTDQAIDFNLKRGVLGDALRLLNIRVSNKRRGLAAEKAEARSRLTRPLQRKDPDLTPQEKRRKVLEKRKLELRKRLTELRKDAALEDHEKATMGNYRRIFPTHDTTKSEKYKRLLESAAKVFTGRPTLRRGTAHPFQSLKEHEVLDLLEQVENDELGITHGISSRGFKPLSSLPSSKSTSQVSAKATDSTDAKTTGLNTRPVSASSNSSKPPSNKVLHARPRSYRTTSFGTGSQLRKCTSMDSLQANDPGSEKKDEYVRQTLKALQSMRIKFPGKSDEEAERILFGIQENWKFHKPQVATYWLVKLDAAKRRKVIEIVKGNVRAILQRIWRVVDLDSLHLCRLFNKLFNRLLWSHGQGLWSCFNTMGDTWESILNRNSELVSQEEIYCCRRVVQLCKDCLLVVYQFASDSRLTPQGIKTDIESTTLRPTSAVDSKYSLKSPNTGLLSVRLARLYKADT